MKVPFILSLRIQRNESQLEEERPRRKPGAGQRKEESGALRCAAGGCMSDLGGSVWYILYSMYQLVIIAALVVVLAAAFVIRKGYREAVKDAGTPFILLPTSGDMLTE